MSSDMLNKLLRSHNWQERDRTQALGHPCSCSMPLSQRRVARGRAGLCHQVHSILPCSFSIPECSGPRKQPHGKLRMFKHLLPLPQGWVQHNFLKNPRIDLSHWFTMTNCRFFSSHRNNCLHFSQEALQLKFI